MPEQDVAPRLAAEKVILEAELRDALQAIVFLHGKTLEAKMNKLIVKDDYGTENYEKFYKERDYFIKTVMGRDLPPSIWELFFPNGETPEQIFHENLGLYISRSDETQTPLVKSTRPINEIVQQAEMLLSESAAASRSKSAEETNEDPLYGQALQVVLHNKKASISLVQRSLSIGYNRAAQLLQTMESRHIVTSMGSSGQREVLDFSLMSNIKPNLISTLDVGELADTLRPRQLVEDHWRAFLLAGRQDAAIGARMIEAFEQRVVAQAASMPADKGAAFKAAVESERERLFSEYESSPELLKKRLNISERSAPVSGYSRHSNRQGFGELVVRTAVRATVWEIVRSFFRR